MAHTLLHINASVGNRCIPRDWHRVSFQVLPLSRTHFNVETDVADAWRAALFTSECLRGTRRRTSCLTEAEVFYPSQPKPEAASACSFATITKNTANQSFRQWLSFGEDGFW